MHRKMNFHTFLTMIPDTLYTDDDRYPRLGLHRDLHFSYSGRRSFMKSLPSLKPEIPGFLAGWLLI